MPVFKVRNSAFPMLLYEEVVCFLGAYLNIWGLVCIMWKGKKSRVVWLLCFLEACSYSATNIKVV